MPTTYRSARPLLTIAGQDKPALAEGLLELEIVEHIEGLYRLEALFGNWGPKGGKVDFLYFDRSLLEFGKEIQVKLGDSAIFQGRITALEGRFPTGAAPQLAILAEDSLQQLRLTRRSRSFENISDQDLFNQVAREHNLQTQISLTGPTHKVLAQINQSDLAFLRDRARAIGAEVWVEDKTLKAKRRSERTGTPLELTYGGGLREFNVLADLSQQCTALVVSGWDVASKESIKEEVEESVIRSELDGKQSGSSIMQTVFGARKQTLAHGVPFTTQEAKTQAEAAYRLLSRRFVVGQGISEPDARLRVGTTVTLKGLGGMFNGNYYVSQTRYRFDTSLGSRLEFTAERPGLGRP
jgi:uncharacterized protein